MKASFVISGLKVNVSAIYKGDKKADWGDDSRAMQNWNNHRVTVSTEHGRCSFEFWASIANPELRTKQDLIGALACFVSDSLAGKSDFEDFCSEFGYDSDSRRAEKIHKACKRMYAKFSRIIVDYRDIYEFSNAVSDLENA